MATIVLDPGHGGTTKVGGSSPNNAKGPTGLLEKTVTLDVGLRAEAVLKAAGHKVILTRTTDNNLGLAARAAVAKAANADIFVSIHLNGFDGTQHGTETLCDLSYSPSSAAFSLTIQAALCAATKLVDRNKGKVKAQSLGVLKASSHAAKTACCLIEISFMDTVTEETRLKTTVYRQAVAEAVAKGITNHLAKVGEEGIAVAVSKPKAAEDGFSLMHELNRLESAGRSKELSTKTSPRNDLSEFAIIGIGEGFDPKARSPESALESVGFDMAAFEAHVASLGLRHIKARELLFLGASNGSGPCGGKNSRPPAHLWKNISATAQMLDQIRELLGAECRVLSAYRAPGYNSCIGGESASLHMKFNAIDFKCASGTSADWHAVAKKVRASNNKFAGGIGKYPGFIHIDTRGAIANW